MLHVRSKELAHISYSSNRQKHTDVRIHAREHTEQRMQLKSTGAEMEQAALRGTRALLTAIIESFAGLYL